MQRCKPQAEILFSKTQGWFARRRHNAKVESGHKRLKT